jgi:hypothetical protein
MKTCKQVARRFRLLFGAALLGSYAALVRPLAALSAIWLIQRCDLAGV